ncbi:hypothetical protein DFQ26_002141 [Actinomortierella ambigua]|nr:hypothetical protein DFQ26_002141 [Actinomortierella ambigua]
MATPRWYHASVLLDRKVYFTGGKTADNSLLAEALVLDTTQPWPISEPPLASIASLPQPLAGHSMTRVGEIEGTLLVAGGESTVKDPNGSSILMYKSSADTWEVPPGLTKNDTLLFRKAYHGVVVTGKDGALFHGGYENLTPPLVSLNPLNNTVVNSLFSIKPFNNQFKLSNAAAVSKAPLSPSLARHTITLTKDGHAIILGGINPQGHAANMTSAYIMHAIADAPAWQVQPIKGTAPLPRFDFSTVLINSTTLLVYGGTRDYMTPVDTATHYLDIPSWTWSSPEIKGTPPSQGRWGHSATLILNGIVVIGFGNSDEGPPDEPIVVLDTQSNTWLTDFTPPAGPINPGGGGGGSSGGNSGGGSGDSGDPTDTSKRLPFGAVLAIAFVVTVAVVAGGFYLLVRRKKRRTRNTLAREGQGGQAPRQALRHQGSFASETSLSKSLRGLFSLAGATGSGRSKRAGGNGSGRSTGRDSHHRMSMQTNPMMIQARLTQRGHSPAKLGYPESVIEQGTGMVQVSAYIYPNQACVETEKDVDDGQETAIVYHALTQAQKDAIKLTTQQNQKDELVYELPPVATRPGSGLGFYYGSERRGSGYSLALPGDGAGGVGDGGLRGGAGGGGVRAGGGDQGWRKDLQPALSSSPPSTGSMFQKKPHQQYQPPPSSASLPISQQHQNRQQQQQRYMPPPPATPVTTSISTAPAIPLATRPPAPGRTTGAARPSTSATSPSASPPGFQPTLASSPPSHGSRFKGGGGGGGGGGQYSHQPLPLKHLD